MKIRRLAICLFLIMFCFSSVAFGYVIGSTNFSISGYPEFNNYSRTRPTKPWSKDDYAIQAYTRDVRNYISSGKEYIEAANNDIKRIEENIEKARQEVNGAVEEHNRFVRTGY